MRISVMLSALALLTTTFVTGCADDTDDPAPSNETSDTSDPTALSLDDEACMHMVSGPFADVTATAESDGAPSASFPHTAVHIELAADPENASMYLSLIHI